MADCEHFYSIVSQTSINNKPVGTRTYLLLVEAATRNRDDSGSSKKQIGFIEKRARHGLILYSRKAGHP